MKLSKFGEAAKSGKTLKIELLQGDRFLILRTNFPSEFEFPAAVL